MACDEIRLAIIGGGLAGAAIANALAHHSHLDVHIFEAAPVVSERGAAVALAINTQEALRHILAASGKNTVEDVLGRAQAVSMKSLRLLMGHGLEAGEMILDLESKGEDQGYVVHRGSLMRELWTPLPQANLHVSKKLVSIQTVCDSSTSGGNEELVELGFEDGTTDRFDGVVGADGVFSVVRRFVLREYDWASVGPTPSGFWDLRVLVPYETAKNVLGETYFHDGGDRQHGWVGKKAYFLHDVLEDRTLVQCIMSGFSEEVSDDRKVILTRADLESRELEDWLDGPIASKMIDLLFLENSELTGWYNLEHKNTPICANRNVCIVGDAAHAMTPWQGSGMGQAFEDAAVLGALCGRIRRRSDLKPAFKAFDAVRRPRNQRIVDSSTETGKIMCGIGSEVKMNVQDMRLALEKRWEFIIRFDLERHKQDALHMFADFSKADD